MSESGGALPDEPVDAALLRARIKDRLLGGRAKVCLGRFELHRPLGRGGEGTVYEARDQQGGGVVALKQLHPEHVASGASLKREFRALTDLVYPNLVVLHELFHEQNHWFFTMELVAGVDFLAYVRAASPDAEARLRAALLQLFAGLAALHGAGKMHRDLKPGNVLVRADGSLVILDYGLVVEHGAASGDRAGTPAYAAPEKADGCVAPASDLYAVGVMLFYALTGRLPFAGTPSEMVTQKQREPAPRAEDVAVDVPADLAALCARLLARAPADRPTALKALKALKACCGDGACAPDRSHAAAPLIRSSPTECFVGRHDLLAELVQLSTARARGPAFVLLDGESGIGKSALIQRF